MNKFPSDEEYDGLSRLAGVVIKELEFSKNPDLRPLVVFKDKRSTIDLLRNGHYWEKRSPVVLRVNEINIMSISYPFLTIVGGGKRRYVMHEYGDFECMWDSSRVHAMVLLKFLQGCRAILLTHVALDSATSELQKPAADKVLSDFYEDNQWGE